MTDLTLGPVEARDASALAQMHRIAFPDFFLSQLGEPFLREFYKGFVRDASAITVVAREKSGQPLGVIVGTSEPSVYYLRLLRRRLVGLGIASARALALRPQVVARLARGAFYRGEVGDEPTPEGALLSSICTAPAMRGTGLGHTLLAEWEKLAAAQGALIAHLSTDAIENATVNDFYHRSGWTCDREYLTHEGRRMNLYTKDLRA